MVVCSQVPDYAEVIKNPMDLFTMNNKINLHQYTSARQFLSDIDLITSNALEYNPDKNPSGKQHLNVYLFIYSLQLNPN